MSEKSRRRIESEGSVFNTSFCQNNFFLKFILNDTLVRSNHPPVMNSNYFLLSFIESSFILTVTGNFWNKGGAPRTLCEVDDLTKERLKAPFLRYPDQPSIQL